MEAYSVRPLGRRVGSVISECQLVLSPRRQQQCSATVGWLTSRLKNFKWVVRETSSSYIDWFINLVDSNSNLWPRCAPVEAVSSGPKENWTIPLVVH
ncbi:hypothetical protein J6590_027609 [Homalodisca vitripennis]|nr:hypothetical protein J6590_027609 [Homalodisca vitripennis]